jgi:response regulator RpfG family c-di-GMP phosphodiesterase/DNA-binding CsgD family transcriptional regulator
MGQSADFALHGTAVAMRLAEALELGDSERRDVYYQAQLRFIGCNADTQWMDAAAGDVIELRRAVAPLDTADGRAMLGALVGRIRATHADAPWLRQWLAVLQGVLKVPSFDAEIFPGHCEVAARLGRRLGFSDRFVAGLAQLYARWDGRGVPAVSGERILPAVRVVTVAQDAVLHHAQGGWPAVEAVASQRRGGQYAPAVVDALLAIGPALLANLPTDWAEGFALEPTPHGTLEGAALEDALAALADYTDIQSPWLLRHSTRVAELAAGAAEALGWTDEERRTLRHAAWLHDIGRVGITAGLWGAPRALTASERDRMRLHSHYTAQVLGRAPALAGFAQLAASAHERLDGSGYARGCEAAQLAPAARVLEAADVVAALGEPRPHRAPWMPEAAARIVAEEVDAGRLDADAARAVLAAAGQALVLRERVLPAGLSEREAEVLGELARGRTNKQIAQRLQLSPKTVGHHIESIYAKAGVNTRAGATLFAMEHRLVAPD